MPAPRILALAAALSVPAMASAGTLKTTPEQLASAIPTAATTSSYNWGGSYAGVTLGVGRATSSDRQSSQTTVSAGLHLGHNADMGEWVIGGEVDLAPTALADLNAGGLELDNSGRIKLRAGPKLGLEGRTFAFGTLGAAHVRTSDTGGSYSDTGWLAGLGVSRALEQDWMLTGELVHHRFRNAAGSGNNVNATSASAAISFRF